MSFSVVLLNKNVPHNLQGRLIGTKTTHNKNTKQNNLSRKWGSLTNLRFTNHCFSSKSLNLAIGRQTGALLR